MKWILTTFIIIIGMSIIRPSLAQAYDEQWLLVQALHDVSETEQISFDYVRRDFSDLFQNKFLNLFRGAYGVQSGDWSLWLGAAYVDFNNSQSERRLHQQALRQFSLSPYLKLGVRFRSEQRHFNGDSNIYLRLRARAQLNFFPQRTLAPTVYNELFYLPNPGDRFSAAFNENRFGVGLRYSTNTFDIFLLHNYSYFKSVKTPKGDYPKWLQIQIQTYF
jgi:hypothetical protein